MTTQVFEAAKQSSRQVVKLTAPENDMTSDELIENLVYSAAASVTVPNRESTAALAWASGRLTERYGESGLALLRSRRELECDLANLRDRLTSAFAGLGMA